MMTSSNGAFPLTNANDAERGCFLWSAPEQTAKQTIETPVISDTIALIMTSIWWTVCWFQTPWPTCSGTLLRSRFSSHDTRQMFSEFWGKALIQTLYIIAMALHERHRILNQCQHDFCSRTLFLICSIQWVTLPFLQNLYQNHSNA